MSTMESNHDLVPGQLERLRGRPIPAEGDGGVFSEGWYPVCLSSAIPEGGVHGVPFLDGRVVVTRGDDGDVRVMSAYCMHLGADLAVGQRTADGVRCAFHSWEYDGKTGRCTGIASGDPVPPRAQLFAFPAAEMYGVVFAHNGAKPLYDLPTFEYPESDLYVRTWVFDDLFPVDPWVISANTPDLLHLTELHNFDFINKPFDEVVWHDYSVDLPVHATLPTGHDFDVHNTIYATNYFFQYGKLDGRWFGWAAPFGIPKKGTTQLFGIIAVKPEPGETPEQVEAFADYVTDLQMGIAAEDLPIFAGMHYAPGNLTHGDRVLARFFEYVRHFPRSLHSADFIK